MTGASLYEIWHTIPCALGNEYHALWWEEQNRRRQLNAFGKVPEISVLPMLESDAPVLIV